MFHPPLPPTGFHCPLPPGFSCHHAELRILDSESDELKSISWKLTSSQMRWKYIPHPGRTCSVSILSFIRKIFQNFPCLASLWRLCPMATPPYRYFSDPAASYCRAFLWTFRSGPCFCQLMPVSCSDASMDNKHVFGCARNSTKRKKKKGERERESPSIHWAHFTRLNNSPPDWMGKWEGDTMMSWFPLSNHRSRHAPRVRRGFMWVCMWMCLSLDVHMHPAETIKVWGVEKYAQRGAGRWFCWTIPPPLCGLEVPLCII